MTENIDKSKQPEDLSGVMNTIMGIWGEIQSMGANDVENAAIKDIISRLQGGQVSAQWAIMEVQKIRDRKQDYH